MEFELSETQQLFKRSARELFTQECPPARVRDMIENGAPYSDTLWAKLVEQGWTGLIFSEEAGGLGLGMVEMAVAFEEMGYALAPGAFLSTVALAGSLIAKASPDHASSAIPAICEGKIKAAVALLEEDARWDAAAIGVRAVEADNGFKLSGKKLFVADAEVADLLIVPAKLGEELALLALERDSLGVAITLMPSIDRTRNLYEVSFDDSTIVRGYTLAKGEAAAAALDYAIDVATLALAAEMVGGMQWVLDASVEYAKTRKQFGKPIGQFQAVQHHCANMLLMTESARSAVYYAAWIMGNNPEQAQLAISIAKAYASDSYREVGNLGIQVHGGIGFTWDENLHFYYKRAKASELMFGDATHHRERIARLVIDGEKALVASRQSAAGSGQ